MRDLVGVTTVLQQQLNNCESVVGMKCGDPGVVIGYQVNVFTYAWSVECFLASSHIYAGFSGSVLTLSHLNHGVRNTLWNKLLELLSMVLIPSLLTAETLELDASLDEADTMPS